MAYYPGDEYVDYVGMTVFGDEDWDRLFGQEAQSFADHVAVKYNVLSQLQKPMIVAELGVSARKERQEDWLDQGVEALKGFPLIKAISYFNDRNSSNNRLPTQPDWSL